jgi:NAD+ kinase
MTTFSRAGLIVKNNDESVANTLNDVITCLEGLNLEVLLHESTGDLISDKPKVSIDEIATNCDLAVVIGGDGR